MKIRYHQIVKWLMRCNKGRKSIEFKQIINTLYGMKIQKMLHN